MNAELQIAVARLKELRRERHLTYRQLAEKINIPPTALCRIEMGERIPDPERLKSICDALELSKMDRADLMLKFGYVEI